MTEDPTQKEKAKIPKKIYMTMRAQDRDQIMAMVCFPQSLYFQYPDNHPSSTLLGM